MKELAKNSENRYIWYDKMLETLNKDRVSYPPTDETVIWLKAFCKEMRSIEERLMKKLKNELTFLNCELNCPFMYRDETLNTKIK